MNLDTFVSSRGASISSRTQNGAGFTLNIENNRAIADNAFSPPDNKLIFCNLLPGGLTLTSIPELRTSSSSLTISDISALPPLKSSGNISLKLFFITI